jgi:hypothetical protein
MFGTVYLIGPNGKKKAKKIKWQEDGSMWKGNGIKLQTLEIINYVAKMI